MIIGIDARLYAQTGVGRYLKNLLTQLGTIDSSNTYIIYLRSEEFHDFQLPNNRWQKKRLDIAWHSLVEQILVPLQLKKDKVDVAHFPYFNVPIWYPGKYLLTIHDLIIDHFDTGRASSLPPFLYRLKRWAYKIALSRGIKNAQYISVISKTTKKEVVEHYCVDESKVIVTYDALDTRYKQLKDSTHPKKLFQFPYILYVGNAYPHKNLERLCDAFKLVLEKKKITLVLAGDDSYFFPRLKKIVNEKGISKHVIFYGKANDTELLNLYSYCKMLIFPSLMEGFGLPTFEVLASGNIALISDIPVFREIWKDQVPTFNPYDVLDIKQKILETLQMTQIMKQRILNSIQPILAKYNWKQTAEKTLELYFKIYSNS